MSYDRTRLPDPVGYYESQGLTLKGSRSAKWRTTRCEFHGGSDSMRVNVTNGAFKCMACNVGGGDVLAYHMPLDAHPELGNNAQLGKRLGLQVQGTFGEQDLGLWGTRADGQAFAGVSALAAVEFP